MVQLSDPKVRSLKFMLRCSGNHYLYSEFDDEDAVDKLVLSQYHMIKGKLKFFSPQVLLNLKKEKIIFRNETGGKESADQTTNSSDEPG